MFNKLFNNNLAVYEM